MANIFKTKESTFNFIYSIGASIVILGALFKITHLKFLGISSNAFLIVGLLVEAIIFFIFAFDTPKSEESYAWENVYPELLDKDAKPNPRHTNILATQEVKELETSLSKKLDELLSEAKIDAGLFERLKAGIDKFSSSVEQINSTVDVSASTQRYNDELVKAASHMASMNALYSLQIENSKSAADYQTKYVNDLKKSAEESEKFNQELQGLTSNLNNLNRVYGGMLNAMKS